MARHLSEFHPTAWGAIKIISLVAVTCARSVNLDAQVTEVFFTTGGYPSRVTSLAIIRPLPRYKVYPKTPIVFANITLFNGDKSSFSSLEA